MIPNIGYGELILILAAGLLFFGAKQIPEIARSFGKAINSFKSGMKESAEELENPSSEDKPSADKSASDKAPSSKT